MPDTGKTPARERLASAMRRALAAEIVQAAGAGPSEEGRAGAAPQTPMRGERGTGEELMRSPAGRSGHRPGREKRR
ncbi:hypothetical protein H2509_13935 [Stappia sp. F7233]|uniref:Uncharacterized protein n=1 Tax=Stappia albiluteola TaxID=2758565 RepID=A0A839AH18_9HYPH|nr:hypothetical protein [Stappia albiluteola]MBA5778224.1 hypothetical protein [Stappia albiluteola]